MRLAALLLMLASCATASTAPPPSAGETQEQAWRRARVIQALLNGCAETCPADGLCVDDYGLCWTPCAWAQSDETSRMSMHKAAMDLDPTSTFLMVCPRPRGAVEVRL